VTRPSDQHLTEAELELLVSSDRPGVPIREAASEALTAIRDHLGLCEQCRSQAQRFLRTQEMLSSLKSVAAQPRTASCPAESAWAVVAAGQLDSNEAMQLLKHASECDYCGPQLSLATSLMIEPEELEDEALLATLKTASPRSQAQLARKLASVASPRKRTRRVDYTNYFPSRWTTVAVFGACAVILAVATWVALRPSPETRVNRLLATAYSEQRTMELRFPQANYAPVRLRRGSSSSAMSKPPSLLEAEALIALRLKGVQSVTWLQARGRAQILDGNYDGAIEDLTTVSDRATNNESVLDDLAAAYFQRGLALDRPSDAAQAVEIYSKVLTKTPDDPIALFNRAIASEHIFLYRQALEDWQHYLRIDRTGGWSDEAKQRLHDLTEKLKIHEQSLSIPLLTPQEFQEADESYVERLVDDRIEEYLRVAIHDWLPQVLVGPSRKTKIKSLRSALFTIATVAETNHHDVWLSSLLKTRTSPSFRNASRLLAESLTLSETGNFSGALDAASVAEVQFKQARSQAGVFRAQLEQVYALHLSQQGDRCLSKAAKMLPGIGRFDFTWIRSQLWIETAICSSITGRLDSARTFYKRALVDANTNGYKPLSLRASLGLSDLDSLLGDRLSSWRRDSTDLALFYSSSIPKIRGYSLYTDLDTLADEGRQTYLEIAILRQAIATLGDDPDLPQRAMLHSRLATAATQANMLDLAESEFQEAVRLFGLCQPSDAVRASIAETHIWIAQVDIRRSRFESAVRRLSDIRPEVLKIKNAYTNIAFNEALGVAMMRSGDLVSALSLLRSAVSTAESWLATLHRPRERIFWSASVEGAYAHLAECQWKKGDAADSLETVSWFRAQTQRTLAIPPLGGVKGSQDRSGPDSRFSLVQRALPSLKMQTVLTYLVLNDGILEWVFDDRGVQAKFVQSSQTDVEQLVARYLFLCSDPASDGSLLRQDSRALYDLLLAPLADYLLPNRTLLIQPDSALRRVPYVSLLDADGHDLQQRFSSVVSPGLTFTVTDHLNDHIEATERSLIVGAPAVSLSEGAYFQALPETQREAELIAKRFPQALLLVGSEARLNAVRASLPTSTVFHFAGHAVSVQGHAGLLLAQSKSLDEPQLFGSDQIDILSLTRMKLVVLSSCTTKSSNDFGAPDSDDVVQSLLRAGARTVVASRWDVDTEATRVLMLYFYDALLSGSTPAGALRIATTNLRAHPEYSHPYFWAAFQAYSL
jgi:CHAT domain-containing protein/tetratricopeptide (TPR) repeat protein